jgi:hypothetical protein
MTTTITLADGTVLSAPTDIIADDGSTVRTRVPGVIFIDKERIEYFAKSGNVLSSH